MREINTSTYLNEGISCGYIVSERKYAEYAKLRDCYDARVSFCVLMVDMKVNDSFIRAIVKVT